MNQNQTFYTNNLNTNIPLGSLRSPQQQPPTAPQITPKDSGCCRCSGWFNPQRDSVQCVAPLIVSGGMSITWSLGFSGSVLDMDDVLYMRTCWFVAAIVGALTGAALTSIMTKKCFMLVGSALVILGGILFVTFPSAYAVIMLARHLNGFAVGFVLVPMLMLSGEEAACRRRGRISASMESVAFSTGAFIHILHFILFGLSNVNRQHGMLCILLGIISLMFVFWKLIESPVFLLSRGQEEPALDSLRRLQRNCAIVTAQTYQRLEEHKLYIAENLDKSLKESVVESVPALARLSIYRAMIALSFSLIVNVALITVASNLWKVRGIGPFVVYGFARWIGAMAGMFMMDTAGRKMLLTFAMLACAGTAFGVGILYGYPHEHELVSVAQLKSTLVLIMAHQFFAGLASAPSSTYTAEAFPLLVKPYCVTVVFAAEMLVHIAIAAISLPALAVADYFYALGVVSLVFFIFAALCLPETKRLTLRQAQAEFQGFLNFSFRGVD